MCGNSEESGEVGALGWSFTAGSVSQNTALTSGRPCVVGLATTSSSGNVARMFLGTSDTTQMYISNNPSSSDDFDMYTAVSQAATTNRELRFGLFDDMSAAPPANGIYFQMDSAVEAQWHCVTRSGSSESGSNNDSNTNVAGTQELRIKRSGSTITFYIDGTLVCTNTTNIPTANLNIGFQVQTTTNASATMRIDYFWMVGPRL
jgi:hypothetical protein